DLVHRLGHRADQVLHLSLDLITYGSEALRQLAQVADELTRRLQRVGKSRDLVQDGHRPVEQRLYVETGTAIGHQTERANRTAATTITATRNTQSSRGVPASLSASPSSSN